MPSKLLVDRLVSVVRVTDTHSLSPYDLAVCTKLNATLLAILSLCEGISTMFVSGATPNRACRLWFWRTAGWMWRPHGNSWWSLSAMHFFRADAFWRLTGVAMDLPKALPPTVSGCQIT